MEAESYRIGRIYVVTRAWDRVVYMQRDCSSESGIDDQGCENGVICSILVGRREVYATKIVFNDV